MIAGMLKIPAISSVGQLDQVFVEFGVGQRGVNLYLRAHISLGALVSFPGSRGGKHRLSDLAHPRPVQSDR